ncbi:MAG: response regulator [Gammaproteobacteria bacterium]|nr:response regulator [Gammaproteobacteria bacterium]
MATNHNFAGLDWVVGEISETLKKARQALEAHARESGDDSQLHICLENIHQVSGSLQMIEFYGAALLAEEIEAMLRALIATKVSDVTGAQELLMRAFLQLPAYLERVKAARRDAPATLLPLMNAVRAGRGAPPLPASQFFDPDLSPARIIRGEPHAAQANDAQFKALVAKIRKMYRYAAASVMRQVDVEENLPYLKKAVTRLCNLTAGSPRNPMWDLALAIAEGLEDGQVELNDSVRELLRVLDREMQLLATSGVEELGNYSSDDLIKKLLFVLADSPVATPRSDRLRRHYGLDQLALALPTITLSGPDTDTMRTVVAALNEELVDIKEALSDCAVGIDQSAPERALAIMTRVADTLSVLGVADLRANMLQQIDQLQTVVSSGAIDHAALATIAEQVVALEHHLAALAAVDSGAVGGRQPDRVQFGAAQRAVIEEAIKGLEEVKTVVIGYIAAQWDRSKLEPVPALLNSISGGLSMIPLPRPAQILQACRHYIDHNLLQRGEVPQWRELDALADAVAGVEYYLKRYSDGAQEEEDWLLTPAEHSIAALAPAGELPVFKPAVSTPVADASKAGAGPVVPMPVSEQRDVAVTVAGSGLPTDNSTVVSEPEPEPAAAAPATAAEQAGADTDEPEYDAEIVEIFVEEAGDVMATIDEFLPRWRQDLLDRPALEEVRRAFHTLKGSGRMVGAKQIGELAWALENMLNRLLDGGHEAQLLQVQLVEDVRGLLPALVTAFEQGQDYPDRQRLDYLAMAAEAFASGQVPEPYSSPSDTGAVASAGFNAPMEPPATEPATDSEQAGAEALPAEPSPVAGATQVPAGADWDDDEDSNAVLWEIFAAEADTHLQTVSEFIDSMEQAAPLYTPPSDAMQRALHTLKGSAHMADIYDVAALATPLERFTKDLRAYQLDIDDDILQLFKDAVAYIRKALQQLRNGSPATIDKLEQFQARVAELRDLFISPFAHRPEATRVKAVDPRLLSIFMAEEMDLLIDADDLLKGWQQEPLQAGQLPALLTELQALANGARLANLPDMAELSLQLAGVYDAAGDNLCGLEQADFELLLQAHERLLDMVDAVAAGQNQRPLEVQLLLSLAQLQARLLGHEDARDSDAEPAGDELHHATDADSGPAPVTAPLDEPVLEQQGWEELLQEAAGLDELAQGESGAEEFASDEAPAWQAAGQAPVEQPDSSPWKAAPVADTVDPVDSGSELAREAELDAEIVEIFLEEAHELMEDIEQAVHEWSQDWQHGESGEALKRALHTYKGGARLAGLTSLGDIAHDFETDIIGSVQSGAINGEFFSRLNSYLDQLLKGLEQVHGQLERPSESEQGAPQPQASGAVSEQTAPASPSPSSSDSAPPAEAEILPFTPKDLIPLVRSGDRAPSGLPGQGDFVPTGGGARLQPSRRFAPQEVVKVSAELLEELVNLAGETSISRGRMEEQMSEQGYAIEEMAATISRLQEQLRRLDIETEAQILFRQEQLAEAEDFDPLEMDRYSQLQQLSRSLIESASDLMDLKNTLADKTRDTETLLLQQSRINTDLQEGLMRSRMVPFARMVPRLRRIVRQVSGELYKNVNLEIDNAEGEMDRTVLERMLAPLEHMLRNAIDHGIESPAERLQRGKAETGTVRLSLSREGSDVLLRLVDDGRGIDLEKVRAKAIENGLLAAESALSDNDMMQFILQAGFSTVEAVTQISGRGVGMDVVHAEIKQLGGSMTIHSRWGEGTEFAIRLPFTVSVNRALMVRIGDDRYAIPLNTIEGIVRVSPFELEHYYRDETAVFEYAGEQYQMRYLGNLLNSDARPKLELQSMPLPVVLVRTAQFAVAIQVDMLMGSREIVVKSLGPQFAGVLGVSGATVMGDGSVVVILDPHALIRQQAALVHGPEPMLLDAVPEKVDTEVKTVMVVDDSVTVRKVTGRFLEREGYEVITAKDGADALMQLQDHIPDIMLLDIEMPRMDGFEVAKNMRSSSRLKNIPIIMITSRTGEKHRQRAFTLGVNKYMGKPYQEELLLHNIQQLTGAGSGTSASSHP